jgi:hypothetical protein
MKMKTNFLLTIDHSWPLPPDFIDVVTRRIYTLQCLDQGSNSVTLKAYPTTGNYRAHKESQAAMERVGEMQTNGYQEKM